MEEQTQLVYSDKEIFQIKPLEWESVNSDKWIAKSPIGTFFAERANADSRSAIWYHRGSGNPTKYQTVDMEIAKFDAESEYQRIVREMLVNVVAIMSINKTRIDIVKPIEEMAIEPEDLDIFEQQFNEEELEDL